MPALNIPPITSQLESNVIEDNIAASKPILFIIDMCFIVEQVVWRKVFI